MIFGNVNSSPREKQHANDGMRTEHHFYLSSSNNFQEDYTKKKKLLKTKLSSLHICSFFRHSSKTDTAAAEKRDREMCSYRSFLRSIFRMWMSGTLCTILFIYYNLLPIKTVPEVYVHTFSGSTRCRTIHLPMPMPLNASLAVMSASWYLFKDNFAAHEVPFHKARAVIWSEGFDGFETNRNTHTHTHAHRKSEHVHRFFSHLFLHHYHHPLSFFRGQQYLDSSRAYLNNIFNIHFNNLAHRNFTSSFHVNGFRAGWLVKRFRLLFLMRANFGTL